ncbi:MAG: helix-turn-helix domain containing protein [Gemmatimonadetes bacterium]|nr:helix-turn-helix domain containing protein [Gemmatimonadota bacterium]
MRNLTERQLRRRERILSAARELIARQGYDGVKMRDLAKAADVAPKTLYHQFENKETLLRTAVEERYRRTYRAIDNAEIERGIDRLFFIVDTVATTTRKNLAYARALAPMLSSSTEFAEIRLQSYRKAIDQIADEGEFLEWVDVGLLTAIIYRQVNPLYLTWFFSKEAQPHWASVAKLDMSLILRSVTTGYTRERVTETIVEMQENLKGTRFV